MIEEDRINASEFPVCPWCDEDIDRDIVQDIKREDILNSNDSEFIRCPFCGEGLEVKCSLVFYTYKAGDNDFEEKEIIYDVQRDL